MASPSLYRRVLGAGFDELPDVLKRFHGGAAGGSARGTFRVAWGHGLIRQDRGGIAPHAQGRRACADPAGSRGRRRSRALAPPFSGSMQDDGPVGRRQSLDGTARVDLILEHVGCAGLAACGMNSSGRGSRAFLCPCGFRPMLTAMSMPATLAGKLWCTSSRHCWARSFITKGGSSRNE